MSAFGLTLSVLGVSLFVGILATIILYASGDPVDALLDEHADGNGIGGADFFQHGGVNTDARP